MHDPATFDFSITGLFLAADWVVKSVLVLLAIASVWCWAVILDKVVRVLALRRAARRFRDAVAAGSLEAGPDATARRLLEAARREWQDEAADEIETRAERRQRIELALRAEIAALMDRARSGLTMLATTASAAPFIGLFGTVWGIMNAFVGIARAQDTSLAVVAPGIAEALFATAVGLGAAIPAVIAYNKIGAGFKGATQDFSASAARLAGALSKQPPDHAHRFPPRPMPRAAE
jgi:biopolymer transport protein TolQ